MKQFFTLSLAIFFALHLHAQLETDRQLLNTLARHTKEDSTRVKLLTDRALFSISISPEEIKSTAREAYRIAGTLDYAEGQGLAQAALARYFIELNENAKALPLIQFADSIATAQHHPFLKWVSQISFCRAQLNVDNRAALHWAQEAIKNANVLNDNRILSITQNLLTQSHTQLGEYALALESALKAKEFAETSNNESQLYSAYSQLGYVYSLIGDTEKSIENYKKIQPIAENMLQGAAMQSRLFNDIGENHRVAHQYQLALLNYQKALSHTTSSIDSALYYSNIAAVYNELDSFRTSLQFAFAAIEMHKTSQSQETNPWIHYIISKNYNQLKQPDSAIYYAKPAFELASRVGMMENMRNLSKELALAYEAKNDFKKAHIYHKQFILFRDSLAISEARNKASVITHSMEMGQKEQQIEGLHEQKRSQLMLLISTAAVLLLIIIVAALLLRNNRQKQKAYHLLHKQKQEINEKAKELALQKDNLQQSYDNVQLLAEIGRKITSCLRRDKIIGTVYNHINELLDASIVGIGIYNSEEKSIEFPSTIENGYALSPYSNSINDEYRFSVSCFMSGEEIIINDITHAHASFLQSVPGSKENQSPRSLIYLPLKSKERMLGVLTVQSFNTQAYEDHHIAMLRSIALYATIALENAESYKNLNETVERLTRTQKQLIHAEKMASLGELTAGVAHEIQNPLNFVSNFSDICLELNKEMLEAIENGHLEESVALARILLENQTKILHHSKRADNIVKGMLQHSRSSSGQKEPTDINQLADEYLRLAYHGLRAKDKEFKAHLKTDFDDAIPKVPLVPQEMGRVLLNLISNAFHAVEEKKQSLPHNGYQPLVTVCTKKLGKKLQIRVSDNGRGIPNHLLEKIFQPFFTTKPTGKGTGLGLSMAYDIVKAHDGELSVQSTEDIGTEFTIDLATT